MTNKMVETLVQMYRDGNEDHASYPEHLGSARALERRGLVTHEVRAYGGGRAVIWHITDEGRRVVEAM